MFAEWERKPVSDSTAILERFAEPAPSYGIAYPRGPR